MNPFSDHRPSNPYESPVQAELNEPVRKKPPVRQGGFPWVSSGIVVAALISAASGWDIYSKGGRDFGGLLIFVVSAGIAVIFLIRVAALAIKR